MTGTEASRAACIIVAPYIRRGPLLPGEEARPLSTLLAPSALATTLDRYRTSRWGSDACGRASASLWSKWLFSALLPGPVWLALTGHAAPSEPTLAIAGGLPQGLVIPSAQRPHGVPDVAGLARFVAGPVAHSVAVLAVASDLAPRVFWSNAASMLAWIIERFEAIPQAAEAVHGFRTGLLEAGSLSLSDAANPLANLIGYVPTAVPGYPGRTRRRRVCCLWDRLEPDELCASCPKIDPAEREAKLRAAISGSTG